jgi:hypothetical protein
MTAWRRGLAEVPFMQDVTRWGVLTIGTGLGNARYTNRKKDNGKSEKKAEKDKSDEADNGEKKAKKAKKADA